MPLHRHRRIFRSGIGTTWRSGGGVRRTLMAGLLGVIGVTVVMIVSVPSDLFGRVPVLAGVVEADWPQVAVVDGATLRLRDMVIRLQGIGAPARGQSCTLGAPGADCGAAAAQALAAMVSGHIVTCRLAGRDAAGFPQGHCESGGADLNRALVANGWAKSDGPDFTEVEAIARSRRLGVWQSGDGLTF